MAAASHQTQCLKARGSVRPKTGESDQFRSMRISAGRSRSKYSFVRRRGFTKRTRALGLGRDWIEARRADVTGRPIRWPLPASFISASSHQSESQFRWPPGAIKERSIRHRPIVLVPPHCSPACCFPVHGLPNCLVPALDKAGVREFEGRGLKPALHRPQVARRPPAQVACRPFQSPRPRESRFASAHPRSPPADTPQHISVGLLLVAATQLASARPPLLSPPRFNAAAAHASSAVTHPRRCRPAAAARAPSAASAPAPSPLRESRAQRAESDCDHHRRKSPPRTHRARLALVTRRCAAASHAPCRVCSAVRESAGRFTLAAPGSDVAPPRALQVHSQRRHATDAGASSVRTPFRARRRPVTYAGPSRFALAPRHQMRSGGGASACCATSVGPSPDVPPLSARPPRVPLAVTPQESPGMRTLPELTRRTRAVTPNTSESDGASKFNFSQYKSSAESNNALPRARMLATSRGPTAIRCGQRVPDDPGARGGPPDKGALRALSRRATLHRRAAPSHADSRAAGSASIPPDHERKTRSFAHLGCDSTRTMCSIHLNTRGEPQDRDAQCAPSRPADDGCDDDRQLGALYYLYIFRCISSTRSQTPS
ncbi:hypothetical protein B0H15DRAFT_932568 [Mycena belliarum]|uniref:Uncharacterized protein n=1 Tax=Mycena belliarum TaxID=1033014 RepID=A0AAD6TYQ2_9AGAR|nr:hypothetical protein B0H15DRAFT_932568 [Mycena belliae]